MEILIKKCGTAIANYKKSIAKLSEKHIFPLMFSCKH